MKHCVLILFLISIWCPFTGFAQKDSLRMDTSLLMQEVVVTGTKTFKRKTDSPVVVHVLDSKTLDHLQVCNLSEGLKFQPGLRVETDCQTCNYTQLRMNGLQGGYSQILINGRPIFSPLMSLYGMEQVPVNMIDRIEVVRGGGSSLYGSSAIGGTVNVLTKVPAKSGCEVHSAWQHVGGQASDFLTNGNATWVNKGRSTGGTVFLNRRARDFFDANGDRFSEMPRLENRAVGMNTFFKWSDRQKLEVNASYLYEYRFGGDMVAAPVHLRRQAEERTHHIGMACADYQVNFNENRSTLIAYGALQHTDRAHYTGIFPDEEAAIARHLAFPPYGTSLTTTLQSGVQINHSLEKFFSRRHVLTFGSEYLSDKVADDIAAYRYRIRQHTRDWGTFLQSDWDLTKKINLLSGVRMDQHNLLNHLVFSPRFALLYKHNGSTQFRMGYGTGFRAPQAFDTDLHIAFAGGGVSRVQLSPDLREERSASWSASVNYDHATERYIAGFTIEGFYTQLQRAFVLEHLGTDAFGEAFEKRNGTSATVQGAILELRGNYRRKIQIETGWTLQTSVFAQPVTYLQDVAAVRQFLRTPNSYGFANLTWTPAAQWTANLNFVYTGPMQLVHFGGSERFPSDQMVTVRDFSECNFKVACRTPVRFLKSTVEWYGGMKNLFNAYQTDFDIGKNRDSNYIYGPAQPRTVFVGLKVRSGAL